MNRARCVVGRPFELARMSSPATGMAVRPWGTGMAVMHGHVDGALGGRHVDEALGGGSPLGPPSP